MQVVFENDLAVMFEENVGRIKEWSWRECEPANADLIRKATRARKLRINVEIPGALYEPPPGAPIGVEGEIMRAVLGSRFSLTADLGLQVKEWESLHSGGCLCGYCPSRAVHFEDRRRRVGPGWVLPSWTPEEWISRSEGRLNVWTEVGDKKMEFDLLPLNDLYYKEGNPYRLPAEIQATLKQLDETRRAAEWRDAIQYQEAKERVELAKEFGIEL